MFTVTGCLTTPVVDYEDVPDLSPVPDASVEPEPSADPTPDPAQERDINTMDKVFDALAFSMYGDGEPHNLSEYDPSNPQFFWDAIFYMTSTILTEEQHVIDDYEYMVFSEDEIKQFALICFAGLTDMPALPQSYKNIIQNSKDSVYYVKMTDWFENYTQARPETFSENGAEYSVVVDLFDGLEDKVLATYEFFLRTNPDTSEDATFFYQVTGVKNFGR